MPKPYAEFPKPQPKIIPPARYVPGQGMVTEESAPSADEFPATNMLSGQIPKLKPSGGALAPKAIATKPNAAPKPMPGEEMPELPPVPGEAGAPVIPGVGPVPPPVDITKVPKPKKPVKLDSSILDKMIQNRNSSR